MAKEFTIRITLPDHTDFCIDVDEGNCPFLVGNYCILLKTKLMVTHQNAPFKNENCPAGIP